MGKNPYNLELIAPAVHHKVRFQYVLTDVWFASAENRCFIPQEVGKHFVMPLKTNHKVAMSASDKQQGKYVKVWNVIISHSSKKRLWRNHQLQL